MTVSPALRDELLAAVPGLRAFALSLTGNVDISDDLVQETLVKAWTNFDSFQQGTNLRAWLFTILRNHFYSEMRKKKREVEDADGSLSAGLSVHPEQDGHMDMEDFKRALLVGPAPAGQLTLLHRLVHRHVEQIGEKREFGPIGQPPQPERDVGNIGGRLLLGQSGHCLVPRPWLARPLGFTHSCLPDR
jgi:RNA polymerase sigma factor (sigma-70 family)